MGGGTSSTETSERDNSGVLEAAYLHLPYIPDFLLNEVLFYFVPSREDVQGVYHQLIGESARNWSSYYTKKGWKFIHEDSQRDGPYRVSPGGVHIDILEPGRFFAPRPMFRFEPRGPGYPILSLDKRRPLNPWKPNYVRALRFIKKYDWPHALPRRVQMAIWEIEECGEIAGSTSWINGEAVLMESDSSEMRETLADVFYNRPEDFPLGSEIYLRVLGNLGKRGFSHLVELATHPVTRKRVIVAKTLGNLRNPAGVETLMLLLDDEDPHVRSAALRSLGRVGRPEGADPEGKVRSYLKSEEISHRVWAAQALLAGGDEEQKKYLVQLVKEEKRPLTDLGELGEVVVELNLIDTVPFLINRLKDTRAEVSTDAAEVLQKLTGIDVEFSVEEGKEQRRTAIKSYSRWWEEKKRERSQQRRKERQPGGGDGAS